MAENVGSTTEKPLEGNTAMSGAVGPAQETLAATLWSERRRIFIGTAAAILIFSVYALLGPRQWEAGATLMPPDQSSSSGGALQGLIAARAGQDLGGLASDVLGVRNPSLILVGILQSETVGREMVDKFDLRRVYHRKTYLEAEKTLKTHSKIEEVRLSGMITIRVTDTDPVRARDMVQAYVDAANRLMTQLTTSSAHRERVFLEERLKAVQKDMDDSTMALSQFSSRTRTLSPETQGRAMLTASSDLEGHLITAEAELRGLQQVYAGDNVRVRSAESQVAELRSQYKKMAGEGESSSDAEASDPSQELYPSIRELPLLANTYESLYRRTAIEEGIYEALNKQYELAKVEEAKEIPSVKLLDLPRVPERSLGGRRLIAMLGGLLGFILSSLWVLAEKAVAALEPEDPRRQIANGIAGAMARLSWRNWRAPLANRA